MTLLISKLVADGAEPLQRAGVNEARLESTLLLAHALGRDRTFVITHADEPVDERALETFRKLIERRAAREPLQYLTGCQEFFKLDFEVTPDVLIPRPETELLVEFSLEVLKDNPTSLIADIGTGSGCIAISLLHELPRARAVATDISVDALQVARRNAERHSVMDRLALTESDCFSAISRDALFSLIVSNPPYVREDEWPRLQREVREHEPRSALVSGPDGLTMIRRLLDEAPALLSDDGYFVFEFGFGQSEEIARLIDQRVWEIAAIRADLQNIPRVFVLRKL
jgi:release factor glutamine methyltransferase